MGDHPLHWVRTGPFLDFQTRASQGCMTELRNEQGFGLGIANMRLASDSSDTWSSGALQSIR